VIEWLALSLSNDSFLSLEKFGGEQGYGSGKLKQKNVQLEDKNRVVLTWTQRRRQDSSFGLTKWDKNSLCVFCKRMAGIHWVFFFANLFSNQKSVKFG